MERTIETPFGDVTFNRWGYYSAEKGDKYLPQGLPIATGVKAHAGIR